MAQYKVPQDVEADDKLLGPFSFRQFVYLLIAGGLIALAVGLFQIFPVLAIIPLPFVLLLAALALPLKKDQPMETYLAAIVSYYLKPRVRKWTPGQRESTIMITVPKKKGARAECACYLSCDIGAYNTCLHLCKYCYANDEPTIIYAQNRLHDPTSPFLIGNYMDGDKIHEVPQESWIDMQERLDL